MLLAGAVVVLAPGGLVRPGGSGDGQQRSALGAAQPEGADVNWVFLEKGKALSGWITPAPSGRSGYTTADLCSGAPELPDRPPPEGTSIWTLDRWTRVEILEPGWYVEYNYLVRG